MNIGNIISEWEEDFSSVNDSPYFFSKKRLIVCLTQQCQEELLFILL